MWVTIASVSGGVISLVVIAVMGVRTHRKFERHFVTCVWGSRPIEAARVALGSVLCGAGARLPVRHAANGYYFNSFIALATVTRNVQGDKRDCRL